MTPPSPNCGGGGGGERGAASQQSCSGRRGRRIPSAGPRPGPAVSAPCPGAALGRKARRRRGGREDAVPGVGREAAGCSRRGCRRGVRSRAWTEPRAPPPTGCGRAAVGGLGSHPPARAGAPPAPPLGGAPRVREGKEERAEMGAFPGPLGQGANTTRRRRTGAQREVGARVQRPGAERPAMPLRPQDRARSPASRARPATQQDSRVTPRGVPSSLPRAPQDLRTRWECTRRSPRPAGALGPVEGRLGWGRSHTQTYTHTHLRGRQTLTCA